MIERNGKTHDSTHIFNTPAPRTDVEAVFFLDTSSGKEVYTPIDVRVYGKISCRDIPKAMSILVVCAAFSCFKSF